MKMEVGSQSQSHQLEMESELCESTMRAHKVAATKIRSKDDRFEKHTDFFFPDGIKCSFEHFNVAAKLKARYRMLEVPVEIASRSTLCFLVSCKDTSGNK